MLLHNLNHKIIGVANVTILPGETKEIPAGYEDNPVVNFYISRGWVELVKDPQLVAAEAPEDAKESEVTDAEAPRGKRGKKNTAEK